jgi:hypothetical protein
LAGDLGEPARDDAPMTARDVADHLSQAFLELTGRRQTTEQA